MTVGRGWRLGGIVYEVRTSLLSSPRPFLLPLLPLPTPLTSRQGGGSRGRWGGWGASNIPRNSVLKSLNSLEERLDQRIFFRANRKHIVNLRMIEKVEPFFNGGLLLEIKGGEKIEVSRRQAVRFKEMMSL